MKQSLEDRLKTKRPPKFKSEGERRIADFLDTNLIKYQYEQGVLVTPADEKPRIWYPDFHLPEFGTYIEYYGLTGRQNYDRGIKRKETVYSKMGLTVIPVYPWTLTEDWEGYIMKELEQTIIRRYKKLRAKPYWPQRISVPYHQFINTGRGFGRGNCKGPGKGY